VRQKISNKLLAVLSVFCAISVAGCGAGFNASTMQTQPAGPGVYSEIGAMDVQNAVIVRGEENSATLIVTFINTGEESDKLTSISVSGPTPQSIVTSYEGGLEIPAGGFIAVGSPGQPTIDLVGFAPAESAYVKVSFLFEKAGELRLALLTVPATEAFAGTN
jgi:hypothetical protein